MKMISSFADLRPYGIDPLTGEACGLGLRILCDVTGEGQRILAKCFGVPIFTMSESWNHGQAVGSVMLSHDMLVTIAIFALLENGCDEVWVGDKEKVTGFEATDTPEDRVEWRKIYSFKRRYAYKGTAGDRNIHQMSGRTT